MAYREQNINVLDLRASTGVGVAIPFVYPSAFRTVYTTQEQLQYNLINYILTEPGERVFEPEFGLGLRRKLFDQQTEVFKESLQDLITTGIENYFPQVEVTDLKILPSPDTNTVNVTLSYKVLNTNQEDQITINLQNG